MQGLLFSAQHLLLVLAHAGSDSSSIHECSHFLCDHHASTSLCMQITFKFTGDATTTPPRYLTNDYLNANNKYWAIVGPVSLHGLDPDVPRTQLAETAAAGSTTIEVLDAPDWHAGDEIFITTTGHMDDEHDFAVVASVDGTTVRLRNLT